MKKLLVVLFLFLFCNAAYSETVQLKSGVVFQGEIIELTKDHVVIDDKGRSNAYRLDFDQIDERSLAVLKTLPLVSRQKEDPRSAKQSEDVIATTNEQQNVVPNQDNTTNEEIPKDSGKAQEFYNMGEHYERSGDAEKAIEYFKKAYELEPNSYGLNMALGTVYFKSHMPQDALAYLEKAASLEPNKEPPLIAAGIASMAVRDNDRAEGYFLKLLQLNPGHFEACYQLALINFSRPEKTDEALNYLKKAKKIADQSGNQQNIQLVKELLSDLKGRKDILRDPSILDNI